jgi:hypothetical protein
MISLWMTMNFGRWFRNIRVLDVGTTVLIRKLLTSVVSFAESPELFNLKGQIEHKIKFIEEFVPESCDLTLIGHSIGCKIALEVMRHFRNNSARQVTRGYMLFPTIERMKESPAGIRGWPHVRKIKLVHLHQRTTLNFRVLLS